LNIGSTTLVATSAKYFCCSTLATTVPDVRASPALPFSPRDGAASGRIGDGERVLHRLRQGNSTGVASGIIDNDRALAAACGVVEHDRRTELADSCRAEARHAGGDQDRILVDEVAAEMLIDVAKHGVIFDERRGGAGGWPNGIIREDRITEDAGVTDEVTG
jgi:hypothetical protein